uniref:Malic enzyme n=1 Tax=Heterorhabditis bacteriophora TaxID=37862 RepID=A0A1I7XPG0_HETBA
MGDEQESARFQCDLCNNSREGLVRCTACDEDSEPVLAHATCARQAGFLFEKRAYPQITAMICDKHNFETGQTTSSQELAPLHRDDIVIAWLDGGERVEQGRIEKLTAHTYLTIDFIDGTISDNTLPSDVVSCCCIKCFNGHHQAGSRVRVRWDDDELYDGYYRRTCEAVEYTVRFADGTYVRMDRSDLLKGRRFVQFEGVMIRNSMQRKDFNFGYCSVRYITLSSAVLSKPPEYDMADPQQMALHKLYRPERITPSKRGIDLLKTPRLNKGMAFSLYERQYLGIHGLLPPAFMTEEQQAYRIMTKLRQQPDNLAKYIQLDGLQDRNEKLFYRVLCDNIKELMPIVYTPTVGLACQKFGFIYRNPKGLYITINDNSLSKIHQILCNWPTSNIKAIVVTDGERILGLGDLGTYGIGIPVGKLALYVALAGIQPEWCLPVHIDVGTDNQELLNDPFYTGLRRKRVRGPEYDTLLDNFMKACTKRYPPFSVINEHILKFYYRFGQDTLIQFEDFGNQNAYRLLDKYKSQYCMFNDDIQGTASVVVAGLLATTRITKKKLSQQKIIFLGAGGVGLIMISIYRLIVSSLSNLRLQQALSPSDTLNLPRNIIIINCIIIIPFFELNYSGASTVSGAFTEEIIKEMAAINPRPIIFALSNPTSKAECTAEAAYRYTNGTVLFASGSPFENVEMNGKLYKPGQGNNAYIFPGVSLGCILFKTKHIPDKVFLLAARKVADSVSEKSLYTYSRLYPRLKDIRELSIKIAIEVGNYLYEHNLATLHPEPEDKVYILFEMFIRQQLYSVEYDELINKTYDWPAKDSKHGFPVPVLRRSSMDDE